MLFRSPRYEDPETGEQRELAVDPAISPLRLFVWNADAQYLGPMWESIFIDGSYGTGDNVRSANVFQDEIKKALNFPGSPIESFLATGKVNVDIPDTAEAPAKTAPADPLDNI